MSYVLLLLFPVKEEADVRKAKYQYHRPGVSKMRSQDLDPGFSDSKAPGLPTQRKELPWQTELG